MRTVKSFSEGKTEQFAEITKQGGFLLSYFAAEGEADKTPIDEESAALLAINFLDKHGYPSMQKTYSVRSDDVITIALDCEVADLADATHGTSWGTHKWLGFGVRTGLSSIVGIKFTDDTGASATLASGDATEASDLGLSAGDFVLYIKAEDPAYLAGGKCFTLEADGYEPVTVSMKITETTT